MISQYMNNIKRVAQPDQCILDEIVNINIRRVFYLSIISIPMRFIMIITFLNKSPTVDEKEMIWRAGIIISHLIFLILMIILCSLSYKLKKKDKPSLIKLAVQYATVITILLLSTVITSIDQLVTYSITPFLIACIAIGAIFIIKPLHSLLLFLSGYIVYYITMGIIQPELPILLSNRVNGLTALILGVFLSFILWRSNVINLQQKEHIKCQQKELLFYVK